MFTSIRKYRVKKGSVPELARRVRKGFVPILRELPGFRRYYLLDGGPDTIITITIFDTRDQALISNTRAEDWVRANVLDYLRGLPEVMVGDAVIAEPGEGAGTGRPAAVD